MSNPAVSRRVARALYATPNALDPALIDLCAQASDRAKSFDDLPEKVRKIVLWVEQYIGPPGASQEVREEDLDDGEAGA